MARVEALANAFNVLVEVAFALPYRPEAESDDANFPLLLRRQPVPRFAGVERGEFVECGQAIRQRYLGARVFVRGSVAVRAHDMIVPAFQTATRPKWPLLRETSILPRGVATSVLTPRTVSPELVTSPLMRARAGTRTRWAFGVMDSMSCSSEGRAAHAIAGGAIGVMVDIATGRPWRWRQAHCISDLADHLARYAKLPADRLDGPTMNKIGATDLRNRLHHQHPNLGFHDLMEATVDPCPGVPIRCRLPRIRDPYSMPRHSQGLDERASHRRAAMSYHINLAEAGRRLFQSLNVRIGTSRRIAE